MSLLLDTNVVSELNRRRPDPAVVAWATEVDQSELYVSVATLAELRFGIDLRESDAERDRLSLWLEHDVKPRFAFRTLNIDGETCEIWGRMAAAARRAGVTPSTMDLFIAATAVQFDFSVVTGNIRHFAPLGVAVLNPWTFEA